MGRKSQQNSRQGEALQQRHQRGNAMLSHALSVMPAEGQSRRLLFPIIILLVIGLASSIYLFHLYLLVHSPAGPPINTFCSISKGLNCVTVATSAYSSFLGIPIALWGLEFFGLAIITVFLSTLGFWRLRRWDSLLFWSTMCSLPICGLLAWISASRIHSFCLVCMFVYGTCILLFLVLLVAGRKHLGSLVVDGPRELIHHLSHPRWSLGFAIFSLIGISQFFWAPGLLNAQAPKIHVPHGPWETMPTVALTIGPTNAPLKVEEFTDFQCPHCGVAHTMMMEILKRYPGKIQITHRDFPLDMACNPQVPRPFHPQACLAAYYARCAAEQGKYWPYEAFLFHHRHQLSENNLRLFARSVGIDLEKLKTCLTSQKTRQAVLDDIQLGIEKGIEGTPTFFVNGEKLTGMKPMSFWDEKIKALTGQSATESSPPK